MKFPFPTDIKKYHPISQEEAMGRCSLIGGNNVAYPAPISSLPGSLQKVHHLKYAFVSGVPVGTQSPVIGTTPIEVTFTVRNDPKDAPLTGNMYAYLMLQSGDQFFMSPPCKDMAGLSHHFEGEIPLPTRKPPKPI